MVGFIFWGYILLLVVLIVVGLVIFAIRLFIGDSFITNTIIVNKVVPVVVVLIAKMILKKIAVKCFVRHDTNILALDNFRAYNIYLYFVFFFDCFLGTLSAVIRLVKALIASVFMMSSKTTPTDHLYSHVFKLNHFFLFTIGISYSIFGR
jgi:hypothetical protein